MTKPNKVLVIGSGPIVIGQAAEFDYAGTQACRALREEGVTSVLVNSNPATIMTDEGIADRVYIEPLTIESISRIIARERPDGLLPTLGGQTGLNLAVELSDAGILDKYSVRLLGTPLQTIKNAEERSLFKNLLLGIGEPVPPSETVHSVDQVRKLVEVIGLPLVVRPSYTLGGSGGGIVYTIEELETTVRSGLSASMSHEVLVEKCLLGWKEIEYEVIRDAADNCITVCNMENIDPLGVHTGDSIVVVPTQTLTDKEYQMLRSASLKIIRALGIEGGCNVQFALNPHPIVADKWAPDWKTPAAPQYYIIEVNPRVSRSSALASKATGYPIARVAAKIAVGRKLNEITNRVTGKTMAAFEPAIDYCVLKIPRWPFDKFAFGDRTLGTQMKATGEVMAIDRTFEAALQKAVRSLELGKKTLIWEDPSWSKAKGLDELPLHANDLRLWALMSALRSGHTPEALSRHTGIDPWFTFKFQNIVRMEKRLLEQPLTRDLMWEAKRMGFPDAVIGTLADQLPAQVREERKAWNIKPVYKMVDTCAAEFDAATPYYYSSYEQENEAMPIPHRKALVIGSGPIRIGQGIEFDYCSVHSAWALREADVRSIMANSNPETVSTDFDTSDRLYFEPLDEEGILDLLENEAYPLPGQANPCPPSIVQFGGQTSINLVESITQAGLEIIGSSAENIDITENRRRFEEFASKLGIAQPPGAAIASLEEALKVAQRLGFPVLVRPSYVLGGRAMEIVHNESELVRYMSLALEMDNRHPVLIDKYMQGVETEVDAVCDGEEVLIPGIMEHIERAGVHSGDALSVYPAQRLTKHEIDIMVEYTTRLGNALQTKGLMNVQFVIMKSTYGGPSQVYVIEVNPRASRTIPFISKVTGVPMVKLATKIMLGYKLKDLGYRGGLWKKQKLVGIKAPVFSMSKLIGVDTYLGPEMKSTGEVMGVDYTYESALIKALIAAGLMLQPKSGLLLSIADRDKAEAVFLIRQLSAMGCRLYATEGTASMIAALGLSVHAITKKLNEGYPTVVDVIQNGEVQGVINTITGGRIPLKDGFHIRRAAAEKRIPCFTSLDTARVAVDAMANPKQAYNILTMPEYLNKPEQS